MSYPLSKSTQHKELKGHLLAWVQLAILLLITGTLAVVLIVNPADSPQRVVYSVLILGLIVLITAAYLFNRSGFYYISAGITVACAALAPWCSLVKDPAVLSGDFFPLLYVSLSIILSSIFFPLAVTIALASLQFAALVLVVILVPASELINWPSFLAFIFYIAALSILSNYKSKKDMEHIEHQLDQLKLAQEKLHQKESFYSAVLDHLPIGIAVNTVNPFVRFEYINSAFLRIYGVSRAKLEDPNTFWDAVYEDPVFRETIRKKVEEDTKSGDPKRMIWEEIPITREGQETRYINARNTPIEGKDLVISSVWDVTERVKLSEQLIHSQKMESVGRLAGGVAHDFNNMLGVILGYTELAMDLADPEQPIHAHLQEIYTAAQRSNDLTRHLLAFARKQTINPKIIDVNESVEKLLTMLKRLIGDNIKLSWKPGKGICRIQIDPSQIDQILVNLCVNAKEAIQDIGSITIETHIVTVDEEYRKKDIEAAMGTYVQLSVSDDGFGMDEVTLSQVFEPFYTTKEIGKGTGLGLPTVYGIVKQNNGLMQVHSKPGAGSTFTVFFPLYEGLEQETAEIEPLQTEVSTHATILLVDDDALFRNMTLHMLQQIGYNVVTAATPQKALEVCEKHSDIDLLITDVVMPDMSGKSLCQMMQEKYPHLQCLYMSGYTSDVITHHGVLDTGVRFLQKPFTKHELIRKVQELRSSSQSK